VLCVDDNIFNIVALQTVLEYDLKVTSEKALNGLEALNKVIEREEEIRNQPCTCGRPNGNSNYRIIFMDCNMPIMDGF
jgi:CheY-like chemotaxis protein